MALLVCVWTVAVVVTVVSQLMRMITSQIYALWNLSELKPADALSTPVPLDPSNLHESMLTHSWRPWEHIYALGKTPGKGGAAINQPQYNVYGKYVVKLFFLVRLFVCCIYLLMTWFKHVRWVIHGNRAESQELHCLSQNVVHIAVS